MRFIAAARIATVLLAVVACTTPPQAQATRAEIAELWQEPADLLQRDLFAGPGGIALAPSAASTYEFLAFKTSGTNPGYDVRDASGRVWSVKLGVEAASEVTTSRLLWAVGFHQPPTYYLPQFTLTGTAAGVKQQARFRTELAGWQAGAEWSWYDNPFVDTQPFRGLIVAQMLLNNWDLKTPNNRIYEAADPSMRPRRQFVVRDVGSSLGHSRQFILFNLIGTRGLQGSKNDVVDFEQQGFIKRVTGDKVEFDYRGVNESLAASVTVADVIWICERFARLPEGHWQAAFRAGGYTPERTGRYVRKIKAKIEEGLALRAGVTR